MDMDNARDLVQREALRHMKMGRFALCSGELLSAKAHMEIALAMMQVLMEGTE